MAKKMDEFLLEYYRRRIMHDMPGNQFARYCDYVKNKDFVGTMKYWVDTLEKDSDGNFVWTGDLIEKKPTLDIDTSGDWEMDDDNWEKLFRAFQTTLQAMDARKKKFKYEEKPTKYLKDFFDGRLFSYAVASQKAEDEIKELRDILDVHGDKLRSQLSGFFNDDFTWKDFLKGLKDAEYNTDPKFRDKLQSIASYLSSNTYYDGGPVFNIIGRRLDFTNIETGFEGQAPTVDQMREFKLRYPEMLDRLYREDATYKQFAAVDNSKITKMLDEAKSRIDYNNKDAKEYIPPKRDEELTFQQMVADKWSKTYTNYLEKYLKLQGDRLFYSGYARELFTAIDKEKIKPTDGLDGILSKASGIKKRLEADKKATTHFKWFTDTLNELKADPKLEKTFAGALKHGNQTRHLVEEIIIKAVESTPQKIEEAKSTLELISVMQYGLTTSKVMDAIGKTDFVIFSDGSLSYNKGPIGDLSKVADKTIKAMCMGVGYGFTIVGNAIRLSGGYFKGHDNKAINKAREGWAQENEKKRADAISRRDTLNAIDETEITHQQAEITAVGALATDNVTAGNLSSKESELNTRRTKADTARNRLNSAKDKIKDYEELQEKIVEYAEKIKDYDTQITAYDALITSWAASAMDPVEKDARIIDATKKRDQLKAQKTETETLLTEAKTKSSADKSIYTAAKSSLAGRQSAYDAAQSKYENLDTNINKFKNATSRIEELNKGIEGRKKIVDQWDEKNKDKYRELMAYWDFLQNGRRTHTGKMYSWTMGSKKVKQAALDKEVDSGRVDDDGKPIMKTQKELEFMQFLDGYSL